MRVKYLYVLDGVVYEIPISRIKNGEVVNVELAGKTVLMMELIYETKDRKPFKLSRIVFEDIIFDCDGIYNFGDSIASKSIIEYAFSGIGMESAPLPIPIAPTIPTEEVISIKNYLNRKYPYLLINSPVAIEQSIAKSIEHHKERINKMKESHKTQR